MSTVEVVKKAEDRRIKIVWEALLASYNTKRPDREKIYLETADPIWKARAKNVVHDLDALAERIAQEVGK